MYTPGAWITWDWAHHSSGYEDLFCRGFKTLVVCDTVIAFHRGKQPASLCVHAPFTLAGSSCNDIAEAR